MQRQVPSAFSVEELALIREAALVVHARCRPVADLLYSPGARLAEACGISLDDVTETSGRSEASGVGPGAARPLLTSTRRRDDEVLAPRDVRLLEPGDDRLEGLVSRAPERQRDIVVGDLGLGITPGEPQEVMGGHPLGAKVGRMFEAEQRPLIVTAPHRPAGDFLKRDGSGAPGGPVALPGEEHAAVRDHYSATLGHDRLVGQEPGAQERLPLGPAPMSPPGDVRLLTVRIHKGRG